MPRSSMDEGRVTSPTGAGRYAGHRITDGARHDDVARTSWHGATSMKRRCGGSRFRANWGFAMRLGVVVRKRIQGLLATSIHSTNPIPYAHCTTGGRRQEVLVGFNLVAVPRLRNLWEIAMQVIRWRQETAVIGHAHLCSTTHQCDGITAYAIASRLCQT